ncbi:hypothetical protein HS088_TW13G00118 [Tripterygium wilfordii]|uniref:Symplekin/Pta1 N-terminal domain-containing protein n=1 Tax=Tripterygium wilfordii TaxID=458696 RepID=A0A7J7CTE8_TRIWF|nr:hypothetical protein HS088_TW13G00118 [Tripterygium wilfordii]
MTNGIGARPRLPALWAGPMDPGKAMERATCGMDFFCCTLVEVAIQGLHTSELNGSLQSSWVSMLDLKDRICTIAFQPGSGGVRLLALKFVEAVLLLCTPDPNGSSEPSHNGRVDIHPGIWKDRLADALMELKAGRTADNALYQVHNINESGEEVKCSLLVKEENPSLKVSDVTDGNLGRKRSGAEYSSYLVDDDLSGNEVDDELLLNTSIVGSETQAKYPSSFLAVVLSLSISFPPIASLLSGHQSVSNNVVAPQDVEDIGVAALADHIADDTNDIGNLSEIPGLDSFVHDEETMVASTDLEDTSQEQVMRSKGRSPMDILPSTSTDRSEEHSPKAEIKDYNSLVSLTTTSVGLPSPFVLPKMSAPVVNLADEQKDHLQKFAFTRIVEAYKQIAVSGGSQLRFSLLAYFGIEFPLELDPWKLLQEHIFSDYLCHEGHELTLRVLYRLYREAEEGTDFLSSTTVTSVCEMFLLAVSAVHHLEEVRMKAISLVANKLYPMPSISQQIEDFANEMVISVINNDAMEKMDAEGSITELLKESDFENLSNEQHSVSAIRKDVSSETHQSFTIQSESSLSMPEDQRCMSLYFALCTKAVQWQIPIVVRTMGSSSILLEIISDPPSGSENLLMQDVEILIPVLPFLLRDQVLLVFPLFVESIIGEVPGSSGLYFTGFILHIASSNVVGGLHNGDPCSSCEQADMEVPEVVGRIFEVCTTDQASVIWCVTSAPLPQLEDALNRVAALKAPMVAHASQPDVRSSLPRSNKLVVLGLASDPQGTSQVQMSQAETGDDAGNSDKDATAEKTQESSAS